MNKLGMHIHGMKPGIIQAVELLQPRTITMMDPTAQEIRDIRSVASPVIVVRKYEDGKSFQQLDPRWWAEEYYRMVGDAVSDRLIALGMNEPFGHDSRHLCAPFDEWNRDFILRCRELGPMDGGALAMATGNWTGAVDRYKITDDFPLTCDIAEKFLLHEYCWPTLQAGVPWHVLRYRTWIEDLEASGKEDFLIIISEAGLTQAVIAGRPDHGWRSGGPEGVTEDSYISTIDWYNAELCKDWRVLGCCLYDWAGSHYDWETFEQLGLENRIYQIQAPEIPEPPEPPNGGDQVIRVFDMNDVEQNEQWAKDKYGVAWRPYPAAVGQKVYRLVELREKTGNHSLVTKVIDENGNPIKELPVTFYWAGAPWPPDPPTEVYAHDWYDRFVWGRTNENGDVGPGMGTGAYHGWGEGGPHAVWVHHPNVPSDICEKLGMLAGTFHDHLDQVFQLTTVEEEPPIVDGDLLKVAQDIRAYAADGVSLLADIKAILLKSPPEPPTPPTPPDTPFQGHYFNNTGLTGTPVLVREDAEINFNWGANSPGPGVTADNFSVRWIATKTFTAGTHRFTVVADDGVRLWVGGAKVVDAWKDQSATTYTADVTLSAGQHEVEMAYYERGGLSVAKLSWN